MRLDSLWRAIIFSAIAVRSLILLDDHSSVLEYELLDAWSIDLRRSSMLERLLLDREVVPSFVMDYATLVLGPAIGVKKFH